MKYRSYIFAFLFLSISLTSCWDLIELGGDPCTECQEAINHLNGALVSGKLGCTNYVNSTAFASVVSKCGDGAKAYAVLDAVCGRGGALPSACE